MTVLFTLFGALILAAVALLIAGFRLTDRQLQQRGAMTETASRSPQNPIAFNATPVGPWGQTPGTMTEEDLI